MMSSGSTWRRHCAALGFCLSLVAACGASAQVKVLINPGDRGEQGRFETYSQWKAVVEQAVQKAGGTGTTSKLSTDASQDLQTTRSRTYDIFVAPAHVVGSAIRYGYTPVLGLEQPVQAVLVAMEGSPIKDLADAKGKRLGLPTQDSVVTYLLRGEVNARNTSIKRYFGGLYQSRYQEAMLLCLQIRRCDVVAVEKELYERWVAAGEKLQVVMETRKSPSMSIAIKNEMKPDPRAIQAALPAALAAAKLVALSSGDFEYISTLGYFTPRTLKGAQIVEAATVASLMAKGAKLIDTRNETEFKAGHIPGAQLVPYGEKSAKEPDYDAALDEFDVAKLGSDRNAEMIFACNGPECWKSFKASQAAIKAGFKRVYWFRGGFPEWRSAGQKIASEG